MHPHATPPASRLILSLCDFSGTWCAPYRQAGYDVLQVDLKHGRDVLTFQPPRPPYGVLAAPPCSVFTNAGSRHWGRMDQPTVQNAVAVVAACLALCRQADQFWALENPRGRLGQIIGPHQAEFQPWHFGDPHTKRTCLWGRFNLPTPAPVIPQYALASGRSRVEPTAGLFGRVQLRQAPGAASPAGFAAGSDEWSEGRRTARSTTPAGFARAFFEANP